MKNKIKNFLIEVKIGIKGIFVAFSMYSKIPVPQLSWKDENMKYAICSFPFVGMVIGAVFYLWYVYSTYLNIPEITKLCFALLIPLLISGGIHIDGYMDTCDAIHSYQSKQKKLEILKDAHIGAFSVIMLVVYILAFLGSIALFYHEKQVQMMAVCFVMSRILSGNSVIHFQNAKKEGTLYSFSFMSHKKRVQIILAIEGMLCAGFLIYLNPFIALVILLGNLAFFLYYHWYSLKEFGGITGDVAGWFLCISELISCFIIGVTGLV